MRKEQEEQARTLLDCLKRHGRDEKVLMGQLASEAKMSMADMRGVPGGSGSRRKGGVTQKGVQRGSDHWMLAEVNRARK